MIQARQPSRGLRGGNIGAIPKASVSTVFQAQDFEKTITSKYRGVFMTNLDNAFRDRFGGTIANRDYVIIKGTVSRLGPGDAFAKTGTSYAANTQVTVISSAGNWAQIGTAEWVLAANLSMNLITDAVILAKINELLPIGVAHALTLLDANPGGYLTVNGVTEAAIEKLVNVAENYVIDNTASSLGF